ncbi:MAG TPA: preprotein translocase subunit SecG, partial [Paracoccus sp. (in: a-proteobacteria)]|nr:preprotein translocase subunit SecG [Paracoccus sp. (in: a-proteobacteria)]
MENVVLTVHLIIAVLLIGVVLLQRSEGGGLGLGGGGGGNIMTGRQAANALSRATWLLAGAFLVTSVALTIIAARNSSGASVVDRISPAPAAPAGGTSNLPQLPAYAPPPGAGQPVLPPAASGTAAPAAPAPAAESSAVPAAETPAAQAPATEAPAAEAPAPAAKAPAAP